jgi:hypothetical protein
VKLKNKPLDAIYDLAVGADRGHAVGADHCAVGLRLSQARRR